MGGIALTIFGVAWWCPWQCENYGGAHTVGSFSGFACAIAGVVCAFLGH